MELKLGSKTICLGFSALENFSKKNLKRHWGIISYWSSHQYDITCYLLVPLQYNLLSPHTYTDTLPLRAICYSSHIQAVWKDFSMQTPSMLQSTLFSYQNRVHCSSVERTLFILSISLQFLIVLCLRQKAILAATIEKASGFAKTNESLWRKEMKRKGVSSEKKRCPSKVKYNVNRAWR